MAGLREINITMKLCFGDNYGNLLIVKISFLETALTVLIIIYVLYLNLELIVYFDFVNAG